ncbi:MAG TPA: hypothetical protein VHR43_08675 [Gemmatimonadales bacterium]|nr:hypothetical protein [Gemmatimonadales bacterium]
MHRAVWLSLLLAACGKADNDWVTPTPPADASGAAMTITGVVHHFELEGGFYAIRGDDSVTYDPTNLPTEFQKDGLAVEAVVRPRKNALSVRQVGTLVDVERIRAR